MLDGGESLARHERGHGERHEPAIAARLVHARAVSLLREPFLHFLAIGLAFFAIDRPLGDDSSDERTIVIDDAVRAELRDAWEHEHERAPTDEELEAAIARWTDEEVLYREGLARGLDREDALVRARVALATSYVLSESVVIEEPSEDALHAYFEAHRADFADEARVDFTQVFVSSVHPDAEARANELLGLLETGASPNGLGDVFPGGRRFRLRRVAQLEESFGPELARTVAALEVGAWARTSSRFGVHLVRVDRRTTARAPSFEDARADVHDALVREARDAAVADAVAALRTRWEIVRR